MKWLIYIALAIGVLVANPGCRKDGSRSDKDDRRSEEDVKRSDKDDRQSEGDDKHAKEKDEQFGKYEATSEFTIDMLRPQEKSDFAEIVFNTRKSSWQSEKMFMGIVQLYRGWRTTSRVTDKELFSTFEKSKLELVPRSRLVRITVRSDSPELAADLANVYAKAIELFTDEENRKRCKKAVAQIHEQVVRLERDKKVSSKIYQDLLLKENEIRVAVEQNNEIICVTRLARVPTKPDDERAGLPPVDEQAALYEAKSEITMDTRRPQGGNGAGVADNDMDFYGADYAEIFKTRQSDWRSEVIFKKIIQKFRTNFPNATVTDKELYEILTKSRLELVSHSRLITIAVRSKQAELAAALANAYAEAIESFTDDENKKRCEKAIAQIHEQVVKKKLEDDQLSERLLKFRTENKIDTLQSEQAILNQSLQTTTANVLEYEKRVTEANEWVKVLQAAQNNPENFGELPTEVPRSADIATVYTRQQTVKMELAKLKTMYTSEHQAVVVKESELKAITTEFAETVKRALSTARANLAANQNQLDSFKRKSVELNKQLADIGKKIVQADAGLKQLESEKKVSSEIYQGLLQKENEARIAAEQNNEIIRVGRPAHVPTRPVGGGWPW